MQTFPNMKAVVKYQDVCVAQDAPILQISLEKAALVVDEPLPVATELAVELLHEGRSVHGSAIVTGIRESRSPEEKGQMHLRWVEFSDEDVELLSSWVEKAGEHVAVPPAPVAPPTPPAPAPEPEVFAAPSEMASEPETTMPILQDPPQEEPANLAPQPMEEERTVPIDGQTQLDMPAVSDEAPQAEGESDASSPDEGKGEGGDKKKKNRRRRK